MSFGGFGFGQNSNNNNNQQNTGFGGFGQNTQTTGFGSSGGFGATNTNTGGGLFGNTGGGFGSGGGGFGANASSAFGAPKPAFGAAATTTAGGLFGATATNTNTATSGTFGGFGNNTNNNNNTTFGATGGGTLFGQNKPAFGAQTNTTGSLFGGGSTGTFSGATLTGGSGFGSTAGGFGAGAAQQGQNNGTGSVQFEAHREKEGTQTSVFQSITMQQPYQQYSFEELRLADYQQGKRYGNSNGQAGAFGQSTGFGGFGSTTNNTTGGGLFGTNQQQQQQQQQQQPQNTGTGFGTTGGGLFGAKPAAGGSLFGSTPASSAPSGGLFGATGTTTAGGFGGGTTTGFGSNANAGGGLFGAQQNKPAFGGGFGQTSTPAFGQSSGTTGFGQTATAPAGGGLFGQQNAGTSFGGGFGSNNQQQQQQQQQNQTGGGLFGGGGFGANNQQQQNKPGSLFGSTQPATGGSLFGSQPQQQQSGGLFGTNNNAQQQSGGLFGSKPATTGTGLFGTTTAGGTGGGLFGNLSQQPNQTSTGGGLFGSTANNQQQQKPGLFGGLGQSTGTGTGGSLFGGLGQNTASQPQGGSLFGSTQQPQQQSGGLFGASLGQSQQAQPQQPPQLTASLLGVNPYGNDQLFASLGTSTPSPGPIATPLSGQPKARKPALLPQHKMNTLAASRLITPQKRTGGFGFSYSTYGTPGSAIGTPTGFGNSLLSGGSLGRSLSKSYSASNLRNIYNAETSNLAPGLFTPGRNPYGSGSMKRLSINRNLDTRRSLFLEDNDSTPRKRVLFEESTPNGDSNTNGALNGTSGALVRTEEESPRSTAADSPDTNGPANGATNQSNGSLVTVPEDDQPVQPPAVNRADAAKEHARRLQLDQNPGDYWSRPSMKELQSMSRSELKHVNFVVGRDGIGQIDFGEVDLSDTPLDKLFGQIISLEMRHATVYGDTSSIQKPAPGKALNVPSEITLENSWPRKSGGRTPVYEKQGAVLDKHLVRLRRVNGAEYVNYDANTGAWTFRVQHYTTYGLDYDDEDDTTMSGALSTEVAQQPAAQPNVFAASHDTPQDDVMGGGFESSPDDTFNFRQGKPRKLVPGNFDDEDLDYEDEEESDELQDSNENTQQSFLGDGSVGAVVLRDNEDDIDDYAPEDREEMAGAFPVQPTEPNPIDDSPIRPKSILKKSQLARSMLDTPSKNRLVLESNWTEQLQRTASPRKQTRQALRESQAAVFKTKEENTPVPKPLASKKGFSTSIDIMNSLFGHKEPTTTGFDEKKQNADGKGFEWPYNKRAKTSDAFAEMDEADIAFHTTMKPSWGPDGRLVYGAPADAPLLVDGILINVDEGIVGEHTDIRFAKFDLPEDLLTPTLHLQQAAASIRLSKEEPPLAVTNNSVRFSDFAALVDTSTLRGRQEKHIWSLASVLFDKLPDDDLFEDMPPEERAAFQARRRMDALSQFWKDLTKSEAEDAIFKARTSEEKAIHYLSAGDVATACRELVTGGQFKLASMVSQLSGGNSNSRGLVQKQLQHWNNIDSLSEVSSTIRALYEILAGNTGEVEGKGGHYEDRIQGFSISHRFGLDWKRAFGLRLWYETLPEGGIEDAVLAFQHAVDDGKEKARPLPSFVAFDSEDDTRQDVLWGLLRLYAAQQTPEVHVRAENAFDPANVSDNPIDARLCWQLLQVCHAKDITGSARNDGEDDNDMELASDALTSTYASALTSALPTATPEEQPHLLYTALFVLIHLPNDGDRRSAVQDLLHQTAPLLASEQQLSLRSLALPHAKQAARTKKPPAAPNSNTASTTLASAVTSNPGLSLPREWLATALALWAQAVDKDPAAQARHLLEAGQVNSAHAVLLHQIGPACVVRRNYDTLREVLGGFEGRTQSVTGWRTGGAVYFDFVHLVDVGGRGEKAGVDARQWGQTIERLVDGLAVMGREVGKDASVEERAAVWEMGRVVAEKAGADKGVDKVKVLNLPLAEDASLKYTRELSLGYYRALMAGVH